MIAVDTCSFVAYLQGDKGIDVEEVGKALEMKQLVFPPVVLTEILSDPKLPLSLIDLILQVPVASISEGYWERAGRSRSKVLNRGYKARIADALIAQVCIDNNISLLTRDKDFRHFHKTCGLKLI
jgi:predicted nucleic acid-binding protein